MKRLNFIVQWLEQLIFGFCRLICILGVELAFGRVAALVTENCMLK